MRAPLSRPWTRPIALVGAVGLALGPLDPTVLGSGGFAALWLLALVAGLIGLPLATAQASPLAASRLGVTTGALTTLLLTLTASAALASALLPLDGWAWVVAPLPWLVAASLGRLSAVGALAAVAGLGLLLAAGTGTLGPFGWTLLDPTWTTWTAWFAPMSLAGLLLALVGLGGPPSPIAPRRQAIAVALGLAAILGIALCWASAYEVDFTLTVGGIGATAPLAFAVAAPLLVTARGDLPVHHAGLGLAATALLLGPGQAGLAVWWGALLPLGLALVLTLRALQAPGRARWGLGSGAIFLSTIAAVGWPSLPPLGASLALGVLPAVAVWVVGTRAIAWRSA